MSEGRETPTKGVVGEPLPDTTTGSLHACNAGGNTTNDPFWAERFMLQATGVVASQETIPVVTGVSELGGTTVVTATPGGLVTGAADPMPIIMPTDGDDAAALYIAGGQRAGAWRASTRAWS